MKRIVFLSIALMLIAGCGPVKIEGDVFLVKGDGKPQPSAAKEVIFVEADSLEDLLIEAYLETVESDLKSSTDIIEGICDNAREIMKTEISESEAFLSANTSEQKALGIIDQKGTCASFQTTYDGASAAASSSKNKFERLIAEQESKINSARGNIARLEASLQSKISNKEKALYEEFTSGIIMVPLQPVPGRYDYGDLGWYVSLTNNTNYNIRLEDDICLQYYNAEGNPVGHTSTASSLGECRNNYPEYRADGTVLRQNTINDMNKSSDEFGFAKGGYLSPGQVNKQTTSGDKSYFCDRSATPSETLRMTKKYGEDKSLWPDLSKPDLTKGYTILPGDTSRTNNYGGDKKACGITKVGAQFIALEDEVRTEVGDLITYTSKEVNFREIAEAETYDETALISEQEQILIAAQIEIERLSNISIEDPLIAGENDAQGRLTQCSNALSDNDLEKEFISETNTRLSNIASCSLNDGNVFDTLWGTSLTDKDLNQLGILVDKDYSSEAAYAALKKFTDSEHKTSTNITGHYVLDIPKGNYVVYSSYQDNFISGVYLDNIEISGESQIDLSNTKFQEVGSIASIIEIFFEGCSGRVCSESDLRYTLDIDEAERRYKRRQKDLEDLNDSLRELQRLLGN